MKLEKSTQFLLPLKIWYLYLERKATQFFGRYSIFKNFVARVLFLTFKLFQFQETDTDLPGAVYLCSAAFVFVSLILSVYLHFSLRGKKFAEVVKKPEKPIVFPVQKDKFELSNV